jgi:Ni2+-binding GTPase involved in maturation of urease and hydrogenase
MTPSGRPIGNFLFLGPTGSGKTRIVEATAEALVRNPRAVIKIDCAEFQHSHEIAKLIGSPPGYLGHRETHPLLSQEVLNQYHTDGMQTELRAVRRDRKSQRRACGICCWAFSTKERSRWATTARWISRAR